MSAGRTVTFFSTVPNTMGKQSHFGRKEVDHFMLVKPSKPTAECHIYPISKQVPAYKEFPTLIQKAIANTRAVWGFSSWEVRIGSQFIGILWDIFMWSVLILFEWNYYWPSRHRNGFQEYCYPPLTGLTLHQDMNVQSGTWRGHEWVFWPQHTGVRKVEKKQTHL